jgi:hypothetical protein
VTFASAGITLSGSLRRRSCDGAEVGYHDDLVTALALSVAFDPHGQRMEVGPSIWD